MSLLLPLGLAALAALVVPILIHLIRRPTRDVIDFPALRWLGERARPQRRLRFDDPWLLLVRLVLLVALALLLAQPLLERGPQGDGPLVAVVPGIEPAAVSASVDAGIVERRWLAAGFPALGQAPPVRADGIASLVRELDAQLAPQRALILVVPATLDGLDAERLRLQRPVDWRIVADAATAVPTTSAADAARELVVAGAQADDPALVWLRAAVAAWNHAAAGSARLVVQGEPVAPAAGAWLVWRGEALPAPLLDWVEQGGRVLLQADDEAKAGRIVARDADGSALARLRAHGQGRIVGLLRPWSAEAWPGLLEADFPRVLHGLFADAAAPPMRAPAMAVMPRTGAPPSTPPPFPLERWLAVVVAALFLVERALAARGRRPA